ncbi:MAG: HlyD family efflux transporter periplasmic adaptor subunit [Alteraurantiacibacter sp.]
MSKQVKIALGLLAGAIAIAALMIVLRPEPEEQARQERVPLVEAVAFEPASGPIPVMASGSVEPREEAVIGAQVAGRLTYVHPAFREGGIVPAGAVLMRIDGRDFRNQVRVAEADVAAQDVAVLQAREEAQIAREELDRFAARERGAGIGTVIDGNDYAARILPPDELARLQQEQRSTVATGSLATREPQLRSARAARERAAANLSVAQLALSRTSVAAPFSGLVQEESVSVGSLVQPGQALGTMAATGAFEVRVSLTPNEAALVPGLVGGASGGIAASVFYDFGGRTWRWDAIVDRADAGLDAATRNVEVFLRVPNPLTGGQLISDGDEAVGAAPPLLLGAFVRTQITGTVLESYAAIPSNALRPGNEIWIARDGKLAIVPVRVIQRRDDTAYIATPELARGGRIVTSSLGTPVNGMAVRVAGRQPQ